MHKVFFRYLSLNNVCFPHIRLRLVALGVTHPGNIQAVDGFMRPGSISAELLILVHCGHIGTTQKLLHRHAGQAGPLWEKAPETITVPLLCCLPGELKHFLVAVVVVPLTLNTGKMEKPSFLCFLYFSFFFGLERVLFTADLWRPVLGGLCVCFLCPSAATGSESDIGKRVIASPSVRAVLMSDVCHCSSLLNRKMNSGT